MPIVLVVEFIPAGLKHDKDHFYMTAFFQTLVHL
jgi:hypothetical protein